MAKKDLTGKKIAILVDEGFEQVELIKPRKALDKIGAQTKIISPQEGEVRGWNMKRWGKSVAVDVPLESADPEQFDALLLPGGDGWRAKAVCFPDPPPPRARCRWNSSDMYWKA